MSEMEKKIVPFKQENLMKSNYFIGNKYKASLNENKITYIAMLKIQNKDYEEQDDGIYVSLTASELREQLKNTSGSFYSSLKSVANEMTGNNMGIADDENERFEFITLINKATYENGILTIRFANDLKSNLINIKKNFTNLPAEVVLKFKNKYSFPLYQLLKSQCYYPASYKGARDNVFAVTIGLSELKLDMGVVNSQIDVVKKILLNGKGTRADYDKAIEASPEKMFDRWADFDRRALKPAVKEINEKSDIYVEYKKKVAGRGGKTRDVDFTVWLDKDKKDLEVDTVSLEEGEIKSNLSDADKFARTLEIAEILRKYNIELSYLDIVSIAEAGVYNIENIETACKVLKNTSSSVDNEVGFLITAIKKGFEPSEKRKNKFNNFESRDYNMSELEELLLNKARSQDSL